MCTFCGDWFLGYNTKEKHHAKQPRCNFSPLVLTGGSGKGIWPPGNQAWGTCFKLLWESAPLISTVEK